MNYIPECSGSPSGTHISPPISTLPAELLVQIFSLLCRQASSQSSELSSQGTRASFSAPLLFGKVCGLWRDLAWATPSLWRRIDLVLPIDNQNLYSELLDEWLQRSQELPLSIKFRRDESVRAGNVASWGDRVLPLFRLITEQCRRWEHIDLYLPPGFCALQVETFRCEAMPLLKTVAVRGLQRHSSGPSFLSHAPNLQTLSFHGPKLLPLTSPYLLLTRLTVSGLSLNDVIHLVAHSPNMTELYIAGSPAPYIEGPDHKKLSLACLTSLTMIRPALFSPFLDTLDLPGLLHLHLEGSPSKPLDLDRLAPFIRLNGHSLTSLVLAGFSAGLVGELVENTRALTRLTLNPEHAARANAEMFQDNLVECIRSDVLPVLDYLEFHGAIHPVEALLEAVKMRWRIGKLAGVASNSKERILSRINTLVLQGMTLNAHQRLLREVDEGLDFRLVDWLPAESFF